MPSGAFFRSSERQEHLLRLGPRDVVLVEHLERELPRLAPGAHQLPAFALRLAAQVRHLDRRLGRLDALVRCAARACSIVSQVRTPNPIGTPVSTESAARAAATAWPEDLVVGGLAAHDRRERDHARGASPASSEGPRPGRQLEGAGHARDRDVRLRGRRAVAACRARPRAWHR